MEKRVIKLLKIIAIVCVTILTIELFYICYLLQGKSIYFDGINSIINYNDGFVIVGSNNNNDKYFEKAKVTLYSEEKEKIFEKIYNKGFNGVFFDVVQDNDDIVVVGSYESNEEEHEKRIRSALIVKYDKNGNILYENDFQVLGNSKFTSINCVEDGYIVAGQSIYDNMTIGLSNNGGAYLIKYNKELEVEWKKNYGDNKTAVYNEAIIVNDNIYAVGVEDGNVGIISKYNFDGELIKNSSYKYTDDLGFTGISYSDGKIYVVSSKKLDDAGYAASIIQYDFDLNQVKEVLYDDKGFERFNQILVDKNSNVVAIGTTSLLNNSKSSDEITGFSHDSLIAKYDKNLEKIAVVTYGDEKDDYFTDIIALDNGYLVVGYSSYGDGSYLSKFVTYSDALKVLGVE